MSTLDLGFVRSALFTPGNRPERFAKGAASGADALILDLEDAVAESAKDAARRSVIDHFGGGFRATLAPGQLAGLRVNNIHTAAGLRDLEALVSARFTRGAGPDFVVIPKVESDAEVRVFERHVPEWVPFMVAIESVRGLEAAHAIAAVPRVRALAFGGADLAVELRAELAWEPMFAPRARMVQAAAAHCIGCIDVPHVVLDDDAGLVRDAAQVRRLGFTGKLAIHPKQVGPIQAAFSPTPEEIERASGIVAAYEAAGGNVVEYQGRMVEGPIVKAAERVLAIVRRSSSR